MPITTAFNRLDFREETGPCQPTDAIPGTPEKIKAMRLRVSRQQEAFHHADGKVNANCAKKMSWSSRYPVYQSVVMEQDIERDEEEQDRELILWDYATTRPFAILKRVFDRLPVSSREVVSGP